MEKGPLDGIKVLDLTRILAGPGCTQMLGDMGADVLKIERPETGDDTRTWGPPYLKDQNGRDTNESGYYLSVNRNKRSVAVDITKPEGNALIRRLAEKADILVENFKVGGLAKYGLDYETLREINPRLVYCSITGFGQTGPNASRAGYDVMVQGYGGIMSLTGEPQGEPCKVGVAIADIMCGMHALTGILAALHHRNQSGKGQHIDVALVDSQVSWLANQGVNYLLSGTLPTRYGNAHPNIVPYQVFKAADGHIIVAVGNDKQFQRFAHVVGLPELANEPRYATNPKRVQNRDELVKTLAERIASIRKDTLLEAMEEQGVPGGPVNNLAEVFASDQIKARDMVASVPHPKAGKGCVDLIGNPVKFSATPVSYRRPPPVCGEHTDQAIGEWLGEEPASAPK